MGFIWSLIVGGVLGALAGSFMGKDIPGFVGSWLGTTLFGAWGPEIGGFYIVPALVGAVILIFIVSFAMRSMKK